MLWTRVIWRWQWRLVILPFAFGGLSVYSAGDVLNYVFLASRLQSVGLQTKLLRHDGIGGSGPLLGIIDLTRQKKQIVVTGNDDALLCVKLETLKATFENQGEKNLILLALVRNNIQSSSTNAMSTNVMCDYTSCDLSRFCGRLDKADVNAVRFWVSTASGDRMGLILLGYVHAPLEEKVFDTTAKSLLLLLV
ncbi:hypothetical protein Tco_0885026 [Tanacetum coccineum]